MIVHFAAAAEDDLEQIGDYIARDSPRRALTFVRELRTAAERLGEFPQAYPLVPRYERFGIRRCPYRDYLIFYVLDRGRVDILRILNGAQDYETILFPDN